jgi:hypothetical protein
MKARFQRGGVKGVSPFFAFQDIITSAMAVLIAIIMLLAMYMGGNNSAGGASPKTRELTAHLSGLLDELTRSKRALQTAVDLPQNGTPDPKLLTSQINALKEELASTLRQGQTTMSQAKAVQKLEGATIVQRELDQQRKRIEEAKAELAQLEKDTTAKRETMQRAEKSTQEKEARLMAEFAKRNQIWLIPERAGSSKEPVLVTVSANELILQRFDRPEKKTLNGANVTRRFEAALKNYSKLDFYLVFYFKPSSADHFLPLTDMAKNAGFEIGYDLVGEDLIINFSSPK